MSEDNNKVSIKVFHWFEKMKSNYDENVQGVLKRFEQYNDSQQSRVDHTHAEHITSLKEGHQNQIEQQNKQIAQFKDDINYYKQQIAEQQQSIAQLNNRYDTVVSCLIEEKRQKTDIRDIFSEHDFVTPDADNGELLENSHNNTRNEAHNKTEEYTETSSVKEQVIAPTVPKTTEQEHTSTKADEAPQHQELEQIQEQPDEIKTVEEAIPPVKQQIESTVETSSDDISDDVTSNDEAPSIEEGGDYLFEQAIAYRQADDNEQAFLLFEQAAQQEHVKAMGAMGRSFFLGEGVEENQPMGLAWLINAANKDHPQAIARVKYFQENDPELYSEAQVLSEQLVSV